MVMTPGLRWGVTAGLAITIGGCASASTEAELKARDAVPTTCPSGFELSLVSDRGGQATPLAAAQWFAAHGGVRAVPVSGWRVTDISPGGATVRAGRSMVHVVQGSDRTWQVDSGRDCGPA